MVIALLSVAAGLLALVWSADRFVEGAESLATHFNLSPVLVGAVIVGFGTSSPELFIATLASLDDSPGLAVGNALGSNIANIALILGTVALIAPVNAIWQDIKRDAVALSVATVLTAALLLSGNLSRLDGALLTLALALYLGWAIRDANRQSVAAEEPAEETTSIRAALLKLATGLVVLLISSRILVSGAADIARIAGLSELVIGLTIIAIGSSLPELAASLAAAMRGRADMALGNVVGSNVFNTLAVLSIPAWIAPHALDPDVITRDLPLTVALTVVLIWFCRRAGRPVHRAEGAILLVVYVGYLSFLAWQAMA